MRHRSGLFGLPFAAIRRAAEEIGALVAHAVQRVPKLDRAPLVGDVPQHPPQLPVFDLVEKLAAKLKVMPLLVDAPAPVAHDVNAPLHVREKILQRTRLGVGLKRNVWHPLDGEGGPAFGKRAAIGGLPPDQFRLADGHLVVHENAVLDDGELRPGGADAVVVVTDGGKAPLLAPVRHDIHQAAAVLELAELVRRAKSCPGKVRLPPERAIQLRRMPHRFVDGEPEIGRIEHQVISVGNDRLCLQLFPRLFGGLRRFADKIVTLDVIVTAAPGRGESGARGEFSRGFIDHGHLGLRHGPDPRLGDPAADAGGEKLFLADKGKGRRRVIGPGFQRRLVDRQQPGDLLVGGDEEGVGLHRHVPLVLVGRHLLQNEFAQLQALAGPGDLHGAQRRLPHLILRRQRTARVAPRAVEQDAHRKTGAQTGR